MRSTEIQDNICGDIFIMLSFCSYWERHPFSVWEKEGTRWEFCFFRSCPIYFKTPSVQFSTFKTEEVSP